MHFYLTTDSVKSAYSSLASLEVDNSSILHIFFILKACGYSRDAYSPVSDIATRGFALAHALSSLFSHYEEHPSNYDFISPFSMGEWDPQAPKEPLKKWVGGRIKNNVIGGATTWRKIIDDDPHERSMKFKYNYLQELLALTLKQQKINIFALAIWTQRFTPFPKEMSLVELSKLLKSELNVSEPEANAIFSNATSGVSVSYADVMHNPADIRQLIGPPKNHDDSWISADALRARRQDGDPRVIREDKILSLIRGQRNMINLIEDLLHRSNQVILAGPPGTSKSFYANEVGKKQFKSENLVRIQFHPKYSYQDFIGGHIVRGTDVAWEDGVLYNLVTRAKDNEGDNFLLIIDEINRANVGQVFGETIQCLDRGYNTSLYRGDVLVEFSLPKNLKVIATMNTSDRSLGLMDFAIKRRFSTAYCPSQPDLVSELCTRENNSNLGDLLRALNEQLFRVLKNRELVIGHAFFMDDAVSQSGKFHWKDDDLEMLFNYKILPMIEDFTRGNLSQLTEIVGGDLSSRLTGSDFTTGLERFILNES